LNDIARDWPLLPPRQPAHGSRLENTFHTLEGLQPQVPVHPYVNALDGPGMRHCSCAVETSGAACGVRWTAAGRAVR
jgi:hypothetical protein